MALRERQTLFGCGFWRLGGRWFGELFCVDPWIWLHFGELGGGLVVGPGGHPMKGQFHSGYRAVIGILDVSGNQANGGVGIAHLPHQEAGLLVEVKTSRRNCRRSCLR